MSSDIEIPIDQVDALLSAWDSTSSPGCALAVLQRGNIVYSKGYGMADLEQGIAITPRTRFYVGSVAKQFTAMCVAPWRRIVACSTWTTTYASGFRKFPNSERPLRFAISCITPAA
ncbi:MAG: serine hydrolase [Gammaproteobacteria bacterium]|nr:serine hydrolase [Gammaproteobacteria bacterium]